MMYVGVWSCHGRCVKVRSLFKNTFILLFLNYVYMYVGLCTCVQCWSDRHCEHLMWVLRINTGPPEEQYVPLTTEPHL